MAADAARHVFGCHPDGHRGADSDTDVSSDEDGEEFSSECSSEEQTRTITGWSDRRRRRGGTAFRNTLDFQQVLKDEAIMIGEKRGLRQRGDPASDRPTFSLAFSGGGVRAAAFQSGVLWRLAEMDVIKHIDHFSAVSGGGYITSAFCSHVVEKEQAEGAPEPGQSREWYLDAVCSTILRMQRNAGDFVRDSWKRPGIPDDGAGRCPRILDLPLLVLMVILTISINPISFVVLVVVPVTVAIELYFGAAMRAAFCAPIGSDWIEIFWTYSRFQYVLFLLPFFVVATFAAFVLHKTCCHRSRVPSGKVPVMWYLAVRNMVAALSRITVLLVLGIMLLFLIPWLQILSNGLAGCELRKTQCTMYIRHQTSHGPHSQDAVLWRDPNMTFKDVIDGIGFRNGGFQVIDSIGFRNGSTAIGIPDSCADVPVAVGGLPWFMQLPFSNLSYPDDFCYSGATAHAVSLSRTGVLRLIEAPARHFYQTFLKNNQNVLGWFLALMMMGLLGAILAMPFLGSGVVASLAWGAGPGVLFISLLVFIQFRVFGPLTDQPFLGVVHWNKRSWEVFVTDCFLLALFIPAYQELRSIWHRYYRYSLRVNFFSNGKDRLMHELTDSTCCPHVILTGTANDYKSVGAPSRETICEMSFSSLHMGSKKTGYCRSPRWQSLAKLTALSGAGCLDAISLSMNDRLRFRFWLEVLNLSWGDYILFGQHRSDGWRCVERAGRRIGRVAPAWEGPFMHASHRVTPSLLFFMHYLLVNLAWHLKSKDISASCWWARNVTFSAVIMFVIVVTMSFFAFVPCLSWTMFSPWLRQIHQAVKYPFEGPRPPGLLYITDGGVADCTTLVQLMRRGCERILLVLAAADPQDDLGVLKAAMQVAMREKLGSFFDPSDERRDVDVLFDEFQNSRRKTWLHVGIRYGWDGPESGKLGHLVIVKNRLPDQFKGQPLPPPLTEEEIKYGHKASWSDVDVEEALDMNTDDLGPWACCDVCHTVCNCGPKFPHGNFTGYLYLSPAWFNGLCRLGHDISREAVEALFDLSFDKNHPKK